MCSFCACDNGISFSLPHGALEVHSESVSPCMAVARRDAGVGHVGVGIWRDVSEAVLRTGRRVGRGRDTDFSVPPARIRTGGFPAYGSCLRW